MIRRLAEFDRKHMGGAGTSPEEKLFLHSLVLLLRPKTVLEIGTSAGHATLWLAAAVHRVGGKMVSVDNWSMRHGGRAGGPKAVRNRLAAFKLNSTVKVVARDSAAYMRDRPTDSFDLVWIDGDHSFEKAKEDIVEGMRVARSLVVVHDTYQEAYDTVRLACEAVGGPWLFLNGFRGFGLVAPQCRS